MRALLTTFVLVPLIAFAGWRSVGTSGATIRDLELVDAGLVLVSREGDGGSAALLHLEDGGVTTLLSFDGGVVGAAVFGTCLVAQESGGTLRFGASCGTADNLVTSAPRSMRGFGTDGIAALELSGSTLMLKLARLGSTGSTNLGGASWGASNADSVVRVLRYGAQDLLVSSTITNAFRVSVDGGTPPNVVYANGPYKDFALFERNGLPAVMAANTANRTLWLFPDIRSNAGAVNFTVPGGATHVAMSDVSMVVTTAGGLVSPIPDPANEFVTWRARTAIAATFERVSCLPSRWCAASDTSGTLYVYENTQGPMVSGPSGLTADAGAVVRVTLTASDPDEDPLFHAWSVGSGVVVASVAGAEDGVTKDFSLPGGLCGVLPITVSSTDGLHTSMTSFNLTVGGRGDVVVTAPATTPIAGGGPVQFSVGVDGGCDSATFSWSTTGGQMGTGPTFDYQPPGTACRTSETVTVTATWQSGMPTTTSVPVMVTPTPWGAPLAPIFQQPAMQLTGTTRVWSPSNSEHVCQADMNYPGTALIWDFIDAGATTATIVDGGLQIDAAANCVASQVYAVAHREVQGETLGRRSDAGTLVVDVIPDIQPLDATAAYTLTAFADSGVAFGDTSVLASCLPQRDLASKIFIYDGTTQVAATSTVTPGPWSIPVPGGCAGGAREVVAQLYEDAGFTGAERRAMIRFDSTPAAVGPISPAMLTARCGEGVRGQVVLDDVAGACSAVEKTWRQLEGSPLATTSGTGAIDLQTVALDLSMAGQQLVFEWSVDAGAGNGATATRALDVGVDPFVAVKSRTAPHIRREESSFELEITLTNTTSCAVDGLDVEIPLTAAEPIAGTLTLDGVRLASSVEGNVLRASGVALPASGTAVLKLAANPRLLGTPKTSPTVTLHGLPVSIAEVAVVPASGCGCSTEPGVAVVLLAFFALGRRRRKE
ncbi:MAG: MYXO-CTERM sorting domain-containing protein [Archangium sp.]